jgi:hypothetical protein
VLNPQKTQVALPLLPLNHPSKLTPNRLGAHVHVSKAYAHLSTINFTSTDLKTLQINQNKKGKTFSDGTFFYTLTTAPPNTQLKK